MDAARRAWVEETVGGRTTHEHRPDTGGSRQTFLVDLTMPDETVQHVVLRVDAGGSFTGTELTLAREAAVYRALEPTPVPVPRVIATTPDGSAVLLTRLDGMDDLSGLDPGEHAEVRLDFMDVLAGLHRVDVDQLDLPGFVRPVTPQDHALVDLAMWARLAGGVDDLDPLARYAGSYLRAHAPTSVQRTVLVHGDAGPGNFMAAHGRVTGLLDWEFSHLGDPMDDLAWVRMRSRDDWPAYEALLDRYAQRSGLVVDQRAIAYYHVAVQYRCVVTTSLAAGRGGGARGWPPYLLVTQRYLLALAEALSSFTGVEEPAVAPPLTGPTPRTPWYDHLLESVRAAVRGIDDPALRDATRNAQILVHHLRAHDRWGAEIDEADRADRAQVGLPGEDGDHFGLDVEAAGRAGDERVLRYLLRRTQRRAALWATLLDRPRR